MCIESADYNRKQSAMIVHQSYTETFCVQPKSPHRNTNPAQALGSTAHIIDWEKITAEPMGATTIFCFPCGTNILHIISRFYVGIWVQYNDDK